MYFTNEHLMGMFALGMTFYETTDAELDLLISRVAAGEDVPEKVRAGLAKIGQNFNGNELFQKMLIARKLQRMMKELETITK